MTKVKHFLRLVDSTNSWVGRVISFLIALMICIVLIEVVLRYFFQHPTIWAFDLNEMLFGAYIILAGGHTLLHRGHVNVDIVYSRFSLRGRAIVDLVTGALFLFFCVLLFWKGSNFAWTSLAKGERMISVWAPPLGPSKLMVPIGAFLLLMQGLAKYVRDLSTAITGREYEH